MEVEGGEREGGGERGRGEVMCTARYWTVYGCDTSLVTTPGVTLRLRYFDWSATNKVWDLKDKNVTA